MGVMHTFNFYPLIFLEWEYGTVNKYAGKTGIK